MLPIPGILNPITLAPELNRIDPLYEERERARGQIVLRQEPEWHLEDVCTTGVPIDPKPMRFALESMGSGILFDANLYRNKTPVERKCQMDYGYFNDYTNSYFCNTHKEYH